MKPAPDTQDYSILITDDDGNCRETLREIVEPKGFRTLLASCGEEAVDIVRADPVHLVLLDMHMPSLTGLETLRLVRQINRMLPCILVTGDADQNLMREAYQAQVYSVIPKPINRHEVLYTIIRALRQYYGLPEGGR